MNTETYQPVYVKVCKVAGPAGTYDFTVSADVGQVLNPTLSLAVGECKFAWKSTAVDQPAGSVTVTEVNIPTNVFVSQIVYELYSPGDSHGIFSITGQDYLTVPVDGTNGAFVYFVNDEDEDEPGYEGCTPGYWKQTQHFDSYPAGYSPYMLFSAAGFANAFPGQSMLQVLSLNGGGLNALGRHSAAALLNAASGDVDYGMSVGDVISAFNAAYASGVYEGTKDGFETMNERGCPLN